MPTPTHSRNLRRLSIENLEARELLAFDVYAQLAIELINQARMDPAAAISRHPTISDINTGITDPSDRITLDPKQPLAPHQILMDTAEAHNNDMRTNESFSHVGSDDRRAIDQDDVDGRIRDAGYEYSGAAENLAQVPFFHPTLNNIQPNTAFPDGSASRDREEAVHDLHDVLFASPEHRPNMLRDTYREVGIDILEFTGPWTIYPALDIGLTTQNFGFRSDRAILTGVVIDDMDNDDFYDIGEGLEDFQVVAMQDGVEIGMTVGFSTGGYAVELAPGTYMIHVTGPGIQRVQEVTIGDENVKVDFETGIDSVAPTITPLADQTAIPSQPLSFTVEFADINLPSDSHTGTIDWGDSTPIQTINAASNPLALDHTFSAPGDFTVSVTIEDSDGNMAEDSFVVQVGMIPSVVSVDAPTVQFGEPTVITVQVADADSGASATIDFGDGNSTTIESQNGTGREGFIVSHTYATPQQYPLTLSITNGDGTASSDFTSANAHVLPSVSWQNPANALDVNDNGAVTPLDALSVINEINNPQMTNVTNGSIATNEPPRAFLDVNDDGFVTPLDALAVINELNRLSQSPSATAALFAFFDDRSPDNDEE